MAKSLASVAPNATFEEAVKFQVPGKSNQSIKFRFNYFPGDELQALTGEFSSIADKVKAESNMLTEAEELQATYRAQAEMVRKIADGWELTDEFNAQNITSLLNAHRGIFFLIFNAFLEALSAAKAKN